MTTSIVKPYPGTSRPMLFINDQPYSGLSYMTYRPDPRSVQQFRDAGCRLFFFSCTSDDCMYEFSERVWLAPDRFDYGAFDERLKLFMDHAGKDAFFIPRIYMTSPPWWDEQHPNELVRFDDGATDHGPHFCTARKATYPSLASQIWRSDTVANLRKLIRYIEDGPYADRIAGYHVASQHTEEWFAFWIYQDYLGDYSQPARAAWRRWLADKYDDDAQLRQAWGRPDVSLETADIPSGDERRAHYRAEFRWIPQEQPAVDFARFFSDLMAETMELFAHTAKEEVGGQKVVGAFYGYLLQLAEHIPVSGHLATHRAWSSPDIDFFTSPTASLHQKLGGGYSFFMAPPQSLRARGKLWINENDAPTSVHMAGWGDGWRQNKLEVENGWDSRMLQRRELASTLAHGAAMWWFDMTSGWYDGEGHLEEIAQAFALGERLKTRPLESVAEILVVVDATAMAYQGWRTLLGPCIPHLVTQLGHIGAPFDLCEISEIHEVLASRHRLALFANPWFLPELRADQLQKLLRPSDCTAVWLYAPGVIGDKSNSLSSANLTGFKVFTAADHPMWPGLKSISVEGPAAQLPFVRRWREGVARSPLPDGACPAEISSEGKMAPLLCAPTTVALDPSMAVLAETNDCRPGIVVRAMEGWTSVYAAAPTLNADWLRMLAVGAGVQLYLENGDTVYANTDFLGIAATNQAGRRTVCLPAPKKVIAALTGETVAEKTAALSLELRSKEVALFVFE